MLWITVGADIKSLRDMFGADLEEMDEDALADVARVGTDKPKKRGGILIRFRSKKVMNHNTITHESDHAAIEIFDYCGCRISVDNQEPFTYLAGWIADCCEQVKTGKFKDED